MGNVTRRSVADIVERNILKTSSTFTTRSLRTPTGLRVWGKHSREAIISVGVQTIPDWDGVFVHFELQLILFVYVDDSKMAGKTKSLTNGWNLIKKVINLDEPLPLGDYLGCGQQNGTLTQSDIDKKLENIRPLIDQDRGGRPHAYSNPVQTIVYMMKNYADQRV